MRISKVVIFILCKPKHELSELIKEENLFEGF